MLKDICFLDTETTSLNAKEGQIIELFMSDFNSKGVRTDYLFRFSFDVSRADKKALEINKYNERSHLWNNVNEFSHYADVIFEVLSKKIIVGHNVSFDASFLSEEFERCGMVREPWKRPIDTYSIASFLIKDKRLVSKSLKSLREYFDLPSSCAHTAKDDVEDLIKVFKRMELYRDSYFMRTIYKLSYFLRSK